MLLGFGTGAAPITGATAPSTGRVPSSKGMPLAKIPFSVRKPPILSKRDGCSSALTAGGGASASAIICPLNH